MRHEDEQTIEAVSWRSATDRYLFVLTHAHRPARISLRGRWMDLRTQEPRPEVGQLEPFPVRLFVAR